MTVRSGLWFERVTPSPTSRAGPVPVRKQHLKRLSAAAATVPMRVYQLDGGATEVRAREADWPDSMSPSRSARSGGSIPRPGNSLQLLDDARVADVVNHIAEFPGVALQVE